MLAQRELPQHYASLLDPARQAQTLHVSCNPHYANELTPSLEPSPAGQIGKLALTKREGVESVGAATNS